MLVARRSLWLHRYPGSCADRAGISAFVDQPRALPTSPGARARDQRRPDGSAHAGKDATQLLFWAVAASSLETSGYERLGRDLGADPTLWSMNAQAERFLKGRPQPRNAPGRALAWKLSAPVALALNDPVAPSVEDDGRMRCPGGRVACSRYRGTILHYRLALRSSGSAGTFQCQADAIRVRFEADRLNRALELAGDPCSMRCRGHCRARAFPRPSSPLGE
jgi:hypothetical protein